MQARDRFFQDALDASAPLLLWALHFFVVYIFVALSCGSTLVDATLFGRPLIESVCLALTVLALLIVAGSLWRAIGYCRLDAHSLLPLVRLGCAMLGMIGILLTSVPMFILSACAS